MSDDEQTPNEEPTRQITKKNNSFFSFRGGFKRKKFKPKIYSSGKTITPKEIRQIDKAIGEDISLFKRLKRRGNYVTLLLLVLFMFLLFGYTHFADERIVITDRVINTTGVDPNSTADSKPKFEFSTTNFIPNFNFLNDVVFYNGFTWVATNGGLVKYNDIEVNFYGGQNGITGETLYSMEVVEDTLWVAYQGGLARYVQTEDRFVSYLDDINGVYESSGISNPKLFYDESGKSLMVSTFEDFYNYDAETDKWKSSSDNLAPINTVYFAATSDGVYAVNNPDQEGGGQVVLFNRKTKKWLDVSPSQINDESIQIFELGGRVIAVGEAVNNISRTVNYLYRDKGIWKSIPDFNEELSEAGSYLLGPRVFDQRHVRVEKGLGKFDIYEVKFENGKFSSTWISETTNMGPNDETLFDPIQDKITSVSELKSSYRLLAVDNNDAIIASYTDSEFTIGADGVVYAQRGYGAAREIINFDTPSYFQPILCNNEFKYAFSGIINSFAGTWESAQFHAFSGIDLPTLRSVDKNFLNKDDIEPKFICNEEAIYWIGLAEIWKLTFSDNKINKVVDLPLNNMKYVTDKKNTFVIYENGNIDNILYQFQTSTEKLLSFALTRNFDRRQRITLHYGLIWVPSYRSETIHLFDLTGKEKKALIHEGVNGVYILDAGNRQILVLQRITGKVNETQYALVNVDDFAVTQIAQKKVPVYADSFNVFDPISIYQPGESKIWISGISSSVFALSP